MTDQVTPSGAVGTPAPDSPRLRPDPGAPPGPSGDHPLSNRARLARLTRLGTRAPAGDPVLEPLFAAIRGNYPKADLREVERAYRIAEHHHRDQLRRSGEPYITHPLAVTQILAEMGMTPPTLCAALLHDTVEDTDYTLDLLRADFGDEVAELVDGVTKLDKVTYGQATQAETVRKMVVAMARDIRVLVIKLADRLHNMRTLRFLPEPKQQQKARETLEIYAPLAHRLGMNTLKWELEDLSFATLYPKMYDEIVRLVADKAPSREQFLSEVIEQISTDLREAKIKATVTGRPKHYYSVYQKMVVRGRDLEDIYDLVGIRVLVDSVSDCYGVLGAVHTRWSPVPGRFKDFIAMPKFNMYQSLHTTVIGPEGKPVELQIRTWDMHRRAEYGIAAHWKYKEGSGRFSKGAPAAGGEGDLAWLRQILDWQAESADPGEFLESLRFDLGPRQVFVFTPKGDVVALPDGSTPVDFAYSVHTEVGHRCIGARVNGKLVPLESALANGDVVEVFTSKAQSAGPSRDWLGFVQSGRARSKIKAWFSKERREEAIEQGKEALTRAMRKQGLPLQRLLSSSAVLAIAHDYRFTDITSLYAAIGEGQVSAATVVQRLVQSMGGDEGAVEDLAETATPSRIEGRSSGRLGDPGVIVTGDGVSVHREDCVNVASLRAQEGRVTAVEWAPSARSVFLVQIQVEALDRPRLLSDVTRALSDTHVNILSASVTTTRDRVAVSRFTFEMGDTTHLGAVLKAVRSVDGVYDVYRVTGGAVAPEQAPAP